MSTRRIAGLVDRLSRYETLVEVGIGRRTAIAAGLVDRGCRVTATDVRERAVPDGVAFVRDDVTDPEPTVYEDAGAVYALRCPPELHRSLLAVGNEHGADVYFTTLGGDPPAVPADPETVSGATLYRVRDGPVRQPWV